MLVCADWKYCEGFLECGGWWNVDPGADWLVMLHWVIWRCWNRAVEKVGAV